MLPKVKLSGDVREKVTCIVCLNFMKEPKKLAECDHIICADCVLQIQFTHRFEPDPLPPPCIRCPYCRQISKQVLDDSQTIQLYKDFEGVILANTEKDITQLTLTTDNLQCDRCNCCIVTVKCKMCDTYYCAECHTRHSENKLTDEHVYYTAAEISDYFVKTGIAIVIENQANTEMLQLRLAYMQTQLQPREGKSEADYNSCLEKSLLSYDQIGIGIMELNRQGSFKSLCENMEQLIHSSITLTKSVVEMLQDIDTTFTFETVK